MTTVALSRFSVRTFSANAAQYLALALALAIPLSNSLTTVLSLLLAIACILYMDGNTWSNVLKHPITIAILVFVSLNLIDMLYSIAASKELTLGLRKATRLLYFPLLLPLFNQTKWRMIALLGFLGAVLVSVIFGLWHGGVYFKDTIFTSLFVAYAIFMLAHLAADFKQYRYLAIATAACFTYYLFFVCSGRAGQLLFIMLALLYIWQRVRFSARTLLPAILLLTAIIVASILGPSTFVHRQKELFAQIQQFKDSNLEQLQRSSMGMRLILATNSWELIKLKPLFGWGTGSFRAAYADLMPEAQNLAKPRTNPHNQYLLTWVELGIPGLIALLAMFAIAVKFFVASKQLEGYLGLGLVLSIAAGCCMNSWLLDFTSGFFFVFLAAVLAAGASEGFLKNSD